MPKMAGARVAVACVAASQYAVAVREEDHMWAPQWEKLVTTLCLPL